MSIPSSLRLQRALQKPNADWGLNRGSGRVGRTLDDVIREGQNRFKAPHLRDYGYRLPIPFCWGPNGSLLLLAGMLVGYAAVVAIALLLARAA